MAALVLSAAASGGGRQPSRWLLAEARAVAVAVGVAAAVASAAEACLGSKLAAAMLAGGGPGGRAVRAVRAVVVPMVLAGSTLRLERQRSHLEQPDLRLDPAAQGHDGGVGS